MTDPRHRLSMAALALLALAATPVYAADSDAKDRVAAAIDSRAEGYATLALEIWGLAEPGYQEEKSSALLQAELAEAGFEVESGVAGMPTAFVASTGKGSPTIGILAEFDALPGLSQDAAPERSPVVIGGMGHGCGHHLLGTGSVAAALAVHEWMREAGVSGTLRVYGTPAEEGGAGKVYMTRAGLFQDVDIVLHWHPKDRNQVLYAASLANKSAKFRFHGESAHAAAAPERGRSALDGVEAMNHMVNLMREHVPEQTRIHYVITEGGEAPNVVPDFAEVFYYARHPDPLVLAGIWKRITAAAQGAALGTGTRVEHEIIHGVHSLLPNETLSKLIDTNLRQVGGVEYDASELGFARMIYQTLASPDLELGSEAQVQPLEYQLTKSSTDVGDVSWNVPTGGVRTATYVPGTPAHSWQAVAAGGMSIGTKGMINAAKVLAFAAMELFTDPELVERARSEFEERRGKDFRYVPMVGDREPPLDYRR
jgi:aminobenzoyl-glutamate utilization protein B